MRRIVRINGRAIGDGFPVFIVAEIGINHNGDVELAKKLVAAAARAGCDAVKFQKRTPEKCVPAEQRDVLRQTPWGTMTYLEYRRRLEFGAAEYHEIDVHCRQLGTPWFASVWDEESVDFLRPLLPICFKIPSAALTDRDLLQRVRATDKPIILSTGMSTTPQIKSAVDLLGLDDLMLAHSTSTYPCPPHELNLRVIDTLRRTFDCPVGYSGHEVGLTTTVAAVALGACYIERHITLDRAMWGSDQAASVEPQGFERLARYIRAVEEALGDGEKRVYDSELPSLRRLRRVLA